MSRDYSHAMMSATRRLVLGSLEWKEQKLGLDCGEPVLVILDALWRYAAAFRVHTGGRGLLANDPLGVEWLAALKGIAGLVRMKGAVAMDLGHLTDSKSQWVCGEMIARCLEEAGFPPEALK